MKHATVSYIQLHQCKNAVTCYNKNLKGFSKNFICYQSSFLHGRMHRTSRKPTYEKFSKVIKQNEKTDKYTNMIQDIKKYLNLVIKIPPPSVTNSENSREKR